jgi:hypothetical protein
MTERTAAVDSGTPEEACGRVGADRELREATSSGDADSARRMLARVQSELVPIRDGPV